MRNSEMLSALSVRDEDLIMIVSNSASSAPTNWFYHHTSFVRNGMCFACIRFVFMEVISNRFQAELQKFDSNWWIWLLMKQLFPLQRTTVFSN
ncbi:hypothetical protein C1H46_015716 [Malus baccata]|uniref:Uncharacterized protein n=1 Tax=Malus baccata TaxID=106549 RepID=A0A540MJN6_MALBA|nr:hypothetical protein C1H46_015716 [Malus baccata]